MIAIKNAKVVLEYGIIFDGVILIEDDRIINVGRTDDVAIPDHAVCYDAAAHLFELVKVIDYFRTEKCSSVL